MNGQAAFLQLFGDIRVTDVLVFVLAAGYLLPQIKKGYLWLRSYVKQTEQDEKALGDAARLPDYHKQSIDIRNRLQKQIDDIQQDVIDIKASQSRNVAMCLGLQAGGPGASDAQPAQIAEAVLADLVHNSLDPGAESQGALYAGDLFFLVKFQHKLLLGRAVYSPTFSI